MEVGLNEAMLPVSYWADAVLCRV